MKPKLILIGGGGHCKSCIDVIEQEGKFEIAGIVDKSTNREELLGYSILSNDEKLPELRLIFDYAFITVGQIKSPLARMRIFEYIKSLGFLLPKIISPRAYVSLHAIIGEGTIIMHDAIVNAGASVGRNCIINTRALIEHDSSVGDHSHISTTAVINGGVTVGQGTFVGSNATTREYTNIHEFDFIKAASLFKGYPTDSTRLLDDIYFQKSYVSLYLTEHDSAFEFKYQERDNLFSNISIKRPIFISDQPTGFSDLETAYGYGGLFTNSKDKEFLLRARYAYQQRCIKEKIIAEFFRFHPYNNYPVDFSDQFNFIKKDRDTVYVDLTLTREERWSQYSATTRNSLRKSTSELVFYETQDISIFMGLYTSAMKKNNAADFYFFTEDYFKRLLALENVKMFAVSYNNQVISMTIALFGREIGHYHLSANNSELLKWNGNYFLLDNLFDYTKQYYRNITSFHLGGGRTSNADDSLLNFKTKFSKSRKTFYIAGKVFIKEAYEELIQLQHESNLASTSSPYFFKYRLEKE